MTSWDDFRRLLPTIRSRNRLATAFVHWRLSSNGLECLGPGEEFGEDDERMENEDLFKSFVWDKKPLKYQDKETKKKFILRAHPIEDGASLLVFLDCPGTRAAAITLDLDQVSSDNIKDVPGWSKKVDDLLEHVRR